MVGFKLKA